MRLGNTLDELQGLIHINMILKDFIHIMQYEMILGLNPNYFAEVCSDFVIMIDDNPHISQHLKHQLAHYLMYKINKHGVLHYQAKELRNFSVYISHAIATLRQYSINHDKYGAPN